MKKIMKKTEWIVGWIKDWWVCTLVLLCISIGTVSCGMSLTAKALNCQVGEHWKEDAVLTDYNDLSYHYMI